MSKQLRDRIEDTAEAMALAILESCAYSLATIAPTHEQAVDGIRAAQGKLPLTEAERKDRRKKAVSIREQITHITSIQEAMSSVSQYYTDPDEAFDGWLPIILGVRGLYLENESFLYAIRNTARQLTSSNELAKAVVGIHQNFLVGAGTTLEVSKKGDKAVDPEKAAEAGPDATAQRLQKNWDRFAESNNWADRELEMVDRDIRDGEWFLELSKGGKTFNGIPQARFDDPRIITGAATTPQSQAPSPNVGVLCANGGLDEEVQVGFLKRDTYSGQAAEGETVPAARMEHSQQNVDMNMRRGVSGFYPVFANIRRAEKLLVNVSALAQIQAAIAVVRKHPQASLPKVQSFQQRQSDGAARTDKTTGKTTLAQKFARASVIDASGGMEYEFPAHSVEVVQFLNVVETELQHIAGNFQIAWEWLVGQETLNPVGPGSPITMAFKTKQGRLYRKETSIFWKVQKLCGEKDIAKLKEEYEVEIQGPDLAVGAALDEAKINEIYQRAGAMSPQTMAKRRGLKYPKERKQTIQHRASRQPDEVMPGDAGSGTPNGEKGGGGDGESKKDGGTRGGAKGISKK